MARAGSGWPLPGPWNGRSASILTGAARALDRRRPPVEKNHAIV